MCIRDRFIGCLAITLNHLNPKPTIEDNINQKLEEAENNPLTDKERELATESQTKEWEEVDKETDTLRFMAKTKSTYYEDKGLDFDGTTSDYSRNKTNGDAQGILRRNVSLNSGGKAQPWAFGAVFKWDGTGNSSESTIWSNSSTSASLSNI